MKYKVINVKVRYLEESLNEAASEGWDVVTVLPGTGAYVLAVLETENEDA